jgi:hypothetical protein
MRHVFVALHYASIAGPLALFMDTSDVNMPAAAQVTLGIFFGAGLYILIAKVWGTWK